MKANVVALIVKDTSKETLKTKEAIKKNIPIITVGEFREQYMYKSEPENKEVNTILAQSLNGKAIVMSGIRDKEIAEFLTTVGATLEESMKPNVVALIVKDPTKETAKTKEAIKKNIPIITVEEFRKQYM